MASEAARAEPALAAGDGAGADAGAVGANRSGRFRVSVSSQSVVQQARLMDSAGTAWHAVKYGNLEVSRRRARARFARISRDHGGEGDTLEGTTRRDRFVCPVASHASERATARRNGPTRCRCVAHPTFP